MVKSTRRKVFYILFKDGEERIFPMTQYDYCVSTIKIWIYPKRIGGHLIIERNNVEFYAECIPANRLWKLRKRLGVRKGGESDG